MAKKLEVHVDTENLTLDLTLSGRLKYRYTGEGYGKHNISSVEELEHLGLRAKGLHELGLLEKELDSSWTRTNGAAARKAARKAA